VPNANVITYWKGYAVWEPLYVKLFHLTSNLKLPIKMEPTECSKMSAYKFRPRGITQKKEYNNYQEFFRRQNYFEEPVTHLIARLDTSTEVMQE
jgi:hypothetical protein